MTNPIDLLDETVWHYGSFKLGVDGSLSRYELLRDDPQFGLTKGDILICESMHWAWADEKVAVIRRESDGHEPGCSQYRIDIKHLSGPRS